MAVAALTAASLVKLLPIVLLVPFRRAIRPRALLLVPVLVGIAYWPFRDAGPALAAGLREYAVSWSANDSLFGLIHAAIAWLEGPVLRPEQLAALDQRGRGGHRLTRASATRHSMSNSMCAALSAVMPA